MVCFPFADFCCFSPNSNCDFINGVRGWGVMEVMKGTRVLMGRWATTLGLSYHGDGHHVAPGTQLTIDHNLNFYK